MLREDVDRVTRRLPTRVREVMQENGDGVYVAGGFVRAVIAGERPSDVDIFVESEATAKRVTDKLTDHPVHRSPFAMSFWVQGQKVQVIHRWEFDSPQLLLDAFDFTVARAVVWCYEGGDWDGDTDPRFYQDLAARRLRYTLASSRRADFEAGGTLLRMAKYLRRGYSISPEHMATVVLHAVHGGDEITYGMERELVDSLREVDPGTWLSVDGGAE